MRRWGLFTFQTSLSQSWCIVPDRTPDSKAWKTVVTSTSSLSVRRSGWLHSSTVIVTRRKCLWNLNISILQEAPCHSCTDRNIHSPRNVGQINDLLHEGRHLGSVLPDSSGKILFAVTLLAGCWLHMLTLLSWTRVLATISSWHFNRSTMELFYLFPCFCETTV